MAESYVKITLRPNEDSLVVVWAKQGDINSRFIEATFVNDVGQPYDLTNTKLRLNVEKPDGKSVFNNCDIVNDARNGKVMIDLDSQILAFAGDAFADVSIWDKGETVILTSRKFLIRIQETMRNDKAIESSNEFGALTIALADVNQYKDVVASIDTKIGLSKDGVPVGETQPGNTIFDVLNKLFIWSKAQSTSAIAENVTYLRNLVGVANPAVGNALTVMGYLKYIGDRGCVKSVQRGIVNASASAVITVSPVNVGKTFINVPTIASAYPAVFASFALTSPTNITVTSDFGAAGRTMSWELIEYY